MSDLASLAANIRDYSWRKAASVAAPHAVAMAQQNMLPPTLAAPRGEKHHSHICFRATEQYKPSCIASCPPVSPATGKADSSNGVPVTRVVQSTPQRPLSCRRTVGRFVLHVSLLAAAVWHWGHLPKRDAFRAGTFLSCPESHKILLFTKATTVPCTERTLTDTVLVEVETTGDTSRATAGQKATTDYAAEDPDATRVAEPGQNLPDPCGADVSRQSSNTNKAEALTRKEGPPKSVYKRRQGEGRECNTNSSTTDEAAAVARRGRQLRPLIYRFTLADTSSNASLRPFPVVLFGNLRHRQKSAHAPDKSDVRVFRDRPSSRGTKPVGRSKQRHPQERLLNTYLSVGVLTLCLLVSAAGSFLLGRSTRNVVNRKLEGSPVEKFVLSVLSGSARTRVILLTVATALMGHSLLRRLTVLLITTCFIGSLVGVLVFYGSQALVDRLAAD